MTDATRIRREHARRLLLDLGTYHAVGAVLGISRQAVQQMIKADGMAWGKARVVQLWCRWPRHDAQEAEQRSERYEARFWARTRLGLTCQIWTGATNPNGYGMAYYKGKRRWAHRVAWELCNGPIPAGMQILHRCDNPPCVNPDHLWLGTARDNAIDRENKGRGSRGKPAHIRYPDLAAA